VYANFNTSNGTIGFSCLPTSPTYNEYSLTSGSILSTSSWQHFLFICEGTSGVIRIYKNGTDVTDAGNTWSVTGNFDTLGSSYDCFCNTANDETNGASGALFDELVIWNKALSSAERTALYNSGAGKTYPFN
jgi:hypothetical protein